MLKGEYFLTDTITVMIEHGAKIRTNEISTWLDTGTIEATLDTNKMLLEKENKDAPEGKYTGTQIYKRTRKEVKVIEPSFIHPSAEISDSVIGPYASIGANCKIRNAVVSDSIIEEGTQILRIALKHSLIGKNCYVEGQAPKEEASTLNIGDNSSVINP